MPRRKDIWTCGIVSAPAEALLRGGLAGAPVRWFDPEPEWCFLADPFGMVREDALHVFAERYDYRTRHGTIERLVFDDRLALADRRPALTEPWHLSYPFVFEAEGAVWMLPEAHRSGKLTLYRAHGALDDWRAECAIGLDCVPVDATITRHEGRWWLFYCPARDRRSKIAELHVAWANHPCGPWTPHPGNPVRRDPASSRPGGTPLAVDGRLVLPVQDCSRTYGGAIRPLAIERLDEGAFTASMGEPLGVPDGAPERCEGVHTLSACGGFTLVDAKRIDRSLAGLRLELERMLGKYAAK